MLKIFIYSLLLSACFHKVGDTKVEEYMDDTLSLAYIMAGECLQCDSLEKAATGSTVLNRVLHSKFPTTIQEVIKKTNQYKGYCTEWYVYDKQCHEIARQLLSGAERDTNIIYFHSIRDKKPPYVKKILYRYKYHEFGI